MRRRDFQRILIAPIAVLLLRSTSAVAVPADPALFAALQRAGHVGLLRHALAPGTGDPPNFSIDACSTQRNLSAEGRAQAREIGARLRSEGIDSARVYTSQWCRCRDTAVLLDLGDVKPLVYLNSFFANREAGAEQTAAMRQWLIDEPLGEPTLLVTHQVNKTALTGVYPAAGEIVVLRVRNGNLRVLGSINTSIR